MKFILLLNVNFFQCLDKDERPTGISCLPVSRSLGEDQTGVILLVGKKDPSDSAFLSSTNSVKMKSVLKLLTVKSGKIILCYTFSGLKKHFVMNFYYQFTWASPFDKLTNQPRT